MTRGANDAHLDAALNPALLREWLSKLDTLLQERGGEEAEEAGAAAAAARPMAAPTPGGGVDVARWRWRLYGVGGGVGGVDAARRVISRWRALVSERKGMLLLRLFELPHLFEQEVLKRLDPTDRTMLAQVGRPWLATVLASGLPRLPRGVRVRLQLREFCTSPERLAWAKANGCPWGGSGWRGCWIWPYWTNPCALAARGGHLEALQWARNHGCPWDEWTCQYAARGGHLEVLRWARAHGCPSGGASRSVSSPL